MEAIKVTELIKNKGNFSYSFEVTPDVSEEDIDNLKVDPLFYSVTWHAKSHQCKDLDIDPIKTASLLRSKQKQVLMHLSCDKMKSDYLTQVLTLFQEKNICNLFVVLGEGYEPDNSDFKSTSEMIKFIRQKTGQYFCIGIAGFPGCPEEKLLEIKDKIAIGADFILTQAFFDVEAFKSFKDRFTRMGIDAPIIPGVFPFETLKQLEGFIRMCRIKVSDDLLEAVNDNEKMDKPCTELIKQLIENLRSKCTTSHFHFFTINKLDNIQKLIEEIN
ncbi:5,10-methylenetetrahydrofolate reductase-like [Helicoverpa zea]|uniref:5,10-methylenetetrahydrofolate reductase-like n=1 Tax=Helicoverpa zea TaxID=7113 RepID=UPI001F576785|nr:5,10-methylenetetrahydrofolate reductase-like [Helicoverpa zea]XP_047028095.1 5,10-methylenetetrahydrofolate reductase-like [Helicoverpa zea]